MSFRDHCFFGPFQAEGIDQLTGGIENTILGENAVELGINKINPSVDGFSLGVEYVKQGALADIELLGISFSSGPVEVM